MKGTTTCEASSITKYRQPKDEKPPTGEAR